MVSIAFVVAAVPAIVMTIVRHNREVAPVETEAPIKLTNITLRLNGQFDPSHAGEIVAARAGFFERAGLHIDIKPGGKAGHDPIASVTNGTNTFGVVSSVAFLAARSKGAPIVAFGAGYLESPVVFFALEKSGIHTPRDFVGKRVLREGGTDSAIIYDALLENLGLSRSQIREVSGGGEVSALLHHEIDVLPGRVGAMSYLLHQQGVQYIVIQPSDYGIHVSGTVYFATEKTIHEHSSAVQRFLEAVIAGWKQTYADYSKSVPLIMAASNETLSPEQVRFDLAAQRNFVIPLARRVAEFDDMQWKQLRIILLDERLIDESIDLSSAVNYDFLKEAYRKSIFYGN